MAEFDVAGSIDPASGRFELRPTQVLARFAGFQPVPYRGTLDPAGKTARVEAQYPGCQEFTLLRNAGAADVGQQAPPSPPGNRPGISRPGENVAPPVAAQRLNRPGRLSGEEIAQPIPPPADTPELRPVIGDWVGAATCGREANDIALKVRRSYSGGLDARAEFYRANALANAVPYSDLAGRQEGPANSFRFVPKQGGGLSFTVTVSEDGAQLSAESTTCGSFVLRQVTDRSPERILSVAAPPAGGGYRPGESPQGRCQALIGWAGGLAREHPKLDMRRTPMTQLLAKAALLFADNDFVPVFGFAYDAAAMPEVAAMGPRQTARTAWNDLAFECRKDPFIKDKGDWIWGHPLWEALHFDVNRLDDTHRQYGRYFSPAALAHAVHTTRALRNEISTNAIAKDNRRTFPDRAKDMLAFRSRVSAKSELLWPSETAGAVAALTRSLNDMAAAEGDRVLAELARTRDPDAGLRLVSLAMRDDTTGILPNLDDARRTAIRARFEARQSEFAAAVAMPLVDRSRNLPTNIEGAREAAGIIRESPAAFALFGDRDRKRYTLDLENRRDEILRKLIGDDLQALRSFPTGADGLTTSARWISEFETRYKEFAALSAFAEGKIAFLDDRATRLIGALKAAEADLQKIAAASVAADGQAKSVLSRYLCWSGDANLPESLEYDLLAAKFGLPAAFN
jgi:hypothetical protein